MWRALRRSREEEIRACLQCKKPLTVYVVTLAILILGVVAYLKMTPDLMPNMDYPYVIVVTSDPGASPESVEKNITKPLEKRWPRWIS